MKQREIQQMIEALDDVALYLRQLQHQAPDVLAAELGQARVEQRVRAAAARLAMEGRSSVARAVLLALDLPLPPELVSSREEERRLTIPVKHQWKDAADAGAYAYRCQRCGLLHRIGERPSVRGRYGVTSVDEYSADGAATWRTLKECGGRVPLCDEGDGLNGAWDALIAALEGPTEQPAKWVGMSVRVELDPEEPKP